MADNSGKLRYTSKECALLAVFVAAVIAAQVALSFVPGVELVTVLFVSYSFVAGFKRGVAAATAFSLLRQIVFGFYPTVLILYLVYYNLLNFTFGFLGIKIKQAVKYLPLIVIVACIGTVLFTLIDDVLTPLWFGYGARAMKAYFISSLSFMIPQLICTAVSVSVLFLPLIKVFEKVYK